VDSPTRPEIHTFPSEDEHFRQIVAKTYDLYSPADTDALAELLRGAFRRVVVRERDSLGYLVNNGHSVWHVFRHGDAMPDDAEV
jgi:hypothetical protein